MERLDRNFSERTEMTRMSVTHTYYVAALGPKGRSAVHWSRRALVHAAGQQGRIGSLTNLPVLPLSLVDEEHRRREWSTGHHLSLTDLGGAVNFRRAADEFCSPIPLPFACTADSYILRHPRCLQRLLGFRFRIVSIGIWFTVRTSAWHSSRSTFDPPPAYIIILIYCISTPYTLFSSIFSRLLCFFFFNHITTYTSPICILLLRGQPIIITFLCPYFFRVFGFLMVFTSGSCEYYPPFCHQPSDKFKRVLD